MKKLLLILLLGVSAGTFADTYVQGYHRKDGTYVEPHYRSDSNQHRYDNYSARGNTNPHTGEVGSQRHEYTNPPAYNNQGKQNGFDLNRR